MSTLDPTLESPVVGEATSTERGDSVAALGVLTTSDHKTIGKLLVGGSLLGLLAVATVGVILGIERVDGDGTLLDVDDLSQLFAAYRVGLVEAVVLPLLLGIAVFVVPLQLGARALAFPRVAAAGLWAWLGGTVLLVIALANNGGPLGGDSKMVELYLGGNVLALVGLTAVAASIATSVLTTRAPGMRLHRAPLFSWAALIGSLALVLVLPVAVGSNIVQFVDYRYGGAAFGGSSGIWPWTSYLYTGPVLGITAAFAAGFVADVVGGHVPPPAPAPSDRPHRHRAHRHRGVRRDRPAGRDHAAGHRHRGQTRELRHEARLPRRVGGSRCFQCSAS